MSELPVPVLHASIDPSALAETAIDLQAMADDIERGILRAIEEECPRVTAAEAPRTEPRTLHSMAVPSLMGIALVGIATTLRHGADPAGDREHPPSVAPVRADDRVQDAVGCCMDASPAVPEEIARAHQAIAAGDAIAFHAQDGRCVARVGKYSADHEWIFLGDAINGLLLCPEQGLYMRFSDAQCLRGTRSTILHDPATAQLLRALPAITSGGKTPLSWGRDTSYGGARGVVRVQRLIEQWKHEAGDVFSEEISLPPKK
ncbi:hypothetical protein FJZ27_04585 [Candidatus Peribacteria bacterium]|nr:hypothetical protein [Candidatus Peribacteria bacterium]